MTALRKNIMRLSVIAGAFVLSMFGAAAARADACDPAVDPACSAVFVTNFPPAEPQYVVAYIDARQFSALMILTAITTAVTLATFVWRASAGLNMKALR